ncbi:ABC transporter permease [Candidatus Bathyarchaeota archaeon]|nr:ABC transporter permease [Candidatus Bathyarchaeota archaeon]
MLETLQDIGTVVWVDLRFLRRNLTKTMALTLIAPVLYLLAFGYGLGRGTLVEGYSYLDFVIPGIIALTAMTTAFNTSGLKLHVDRLFYKCFDETLMAPVSPFSIIVGKALIGVVRGLMSSAAILAVALAFSPLPTMNLLFPLSLVLTCFAFSFLGVIVALLAKTHQDMTLFMSLVILPMSFLSGTFFSLSQVPDALIAVLYASPLTHACLCLRASALGQPFPWLSLAVLMLFGAAFFGLCFVALKKAIR